MAQCLRIHHGSRNARQLSPVNRQEAERGKGCCSACCPPFIHSRVSLHGIVQCIIRVGFLTSTQHRNSLTDMPMASEILDPVSLALGVNHHTHLIFYCPILCKLNMLDNEETEIPRAQLPNGHASGCKALILYSVLFRPLEKAWSLLPGSLRLSGR